MRDLLSPVKPFTATYAQIIKALTDYYNPKPNVIVERYRFYNLHRLETQSVADFVATLRKASEFCEFKNLDESLRDKIVCGINDKRAQRMLLSSEGELTLDRAINIFNSVEIANQSMNVLGTNDIHENDKQLTINNIKHRKDKNSYAIDKNSTDRRDACKCCGGLNHDYERCKYKHYICNKCNIKVKILK